MYKNVQSLLDITKQLNIPLHEVILKNEMIYNNLTEEEVYTRLAKHYDTMLASATRAVMQPLEMTGNLIKGSSFKQGKYASGNTLCGDYLNNIMTMAFSSCEVNASMGRICAAPTAGSCGILPAVLIETARKLDLPTKNVLNALLVASGFGAIFMANATISGAEGGCQAECGVAAAIAAAAAVYMTGGTPRMCSNAVGIALMNCMGLICDPVAGLVQMPCGFRNASQAANAVVSADMALAGQTCTIPVDEIIDAMYKVGRKLPLEFKETSLGGIAATPTAKKLEKKLHKISIFTE